MLKLITKRHFYLNSNFHLTVLITVDLCFQINASTVLGFRTSQVHVQDGITTFTLLYFNFIVKPIRICRNFKMNKYDLYGR